MTVTRNDVTILKTRNGLYSLKVRGQDGSFRTIHSIYDPEEEARTIAHDFDFRGRGILVVLGLGLGYHIAELCRTCPDASIVAVEALPEVREIARTHGPALPENVTYLAGLQPEEVIRSIAEQQMREGLGPVSFFTLSSAVSAFPSYYGTILHSLQKTVSVKLWEKLRYRKFSGDVTSVLLIDSGYFLVQEVEKALRSLHHEVRKIEVRNDMDTQVLISRLIESVVSFRPDLILTMNHLGFDEQGALTSFLRSIEMPVASWYVDSPRLIMQDFDNNVSPYVSMFMWDREYLDQFRALGFGSVEYLPIATDEGIFRPLQLNEADLKRYRADICFVGNSLVDSTEEKMEKINGGFRSLVNELAIRMSTRRSSFSGALNTLPPHEIKRYNTLSRQGRLEIEAAALWKGTLLYRLSCIEALDKFNAFVYGDHGWEKLLDAHYQVRYPLNYYEELPLLYNACRINFNATHLQMGQAVNQRVFDVPACGAFLLTDNQASLEDLFDIGREIAVYKSRSEIPDMVRHYLDNPAERDAVAKRGRERVLREHTYRHRIQKLVQSLKDRYG